ncbi:unnamed protein product, partial [Oikopleura dioica]
GYNKCLARTEPL